MKQLLYACLLVTLIGASFSSTELAGEDTEFDYLLSSSEDSHLLHPRETTLAAAFEDSNAHIPQFNGNFPATNDAHNSDLENIASMLPPHEFLARHGHDDTNVLENIINQIREANESVSQSSELNQKIVTETQLRQRKNKKPVIHKRDSLWRISDKDSSTPILPRLLRWLRINGAEGLGNEYGSGFPIDPSTDRSLKVKVTVLNDKIDGVVAERSLVRGQMVLSLSSRSILRLDEDELDDLKLNEKSRRKLLPNARERLAAYLLLIHNRRDGYWRPFLNSLPSEDMLASGSDFLDPAIQTALGSTISGEHITDCANNARLKAKNVCDYLNSFNRREFLPLTRGREYAFSDKECRWAMGIVLSKGIFSSSTDFDLVPSDNSGYVDENGYFVAGSPGKQVPVLVPLLHFMPRSGDGNVVVRIVDRAMKLIATRTIQKGERIVLNLEHSYDHSYFTAPHILCRYGQLDPKAEFGLVFRSKVESPKTSVDQIKNFLLSSSGCQTRPTLSLLPSSDPVQHVKYLLGCYRVSVMTPAEIESANSSNILSINVLPKAHMIGEDNEMRARTALHIDISKRMSTCNEAAADDVLKSQSRTIVPPAEGILNEDRDGFIQIGQPYFGPHCFKPRKPGADISTDEILAGMDSAINNDSSKSNTKIDNLPSHIKWEAGDDGVQTIESFEKKKKKDDSDAVVVEKEAAPVPPLNARASWFLNPTDHDTVSISHSPTKLHKVLGLARQIRNHEFQYFEKMLRALETIDSIEESDATNNNIINNSNGILLQKENIMTPEEKALHDATESIQFPSSVDTSASSEKDEL